MTRPYNEREGRAGASPSAPSDAPLWPGSLSSRRALAVVVVVGAALRLWQYAADTSLWIDEIALAKGVLALDLPALLTTPLPYNQVAPKGFLLAEKLSVMMLGPSDYALRLFPLACSLVALVFFARLAARTLEGAGPLAAAALFATAAPFITSGSIVKQYSTDVCVAVLLWWLACGLASRPLTRYRAGRAALLGSALVWFSHPGVLMVAALGSALIAWPAATQATARPRRALAPVLVCWGASALAATVNAFANMRPDTREYLRRFWFPGFAPLSPRGILDTGWPLSRLTALFAPGVTIVDGLAYALPAAYVFLTAAGFALLWRRDRRTAALLTAPLVFALGAAVFRQYPFSERLIHFLVPSFMLALGAALEGVRRLLWPYSRALGVLAMAVLLAPAVYTVAATPPAYYTEHMKPVLSYVRERRRPGDGMYVYYGAAPAVIFYGPRYGIGRDEYAVGGCHRGDGRRYLRELDAFRGRARVWVLLTHASPLYREREDILAYLDAVGTRRDSLVVESHGVGRRLLPAEAHLYDLSAGAGAADADSFQLTGPPRAGPRLGCGEGPQAMAETDFR